MTPNRRDVLSWLTATAAVGCAAPGALPSKSSFDEGGGGAVGPGPEDTVDSGLLDSGSTDTGPGDTGPGDTGLADTADPSGWTCEQGDAPLPEACDHTPPAGEGPFYLDDVPEGGAMNRRGADHTPMTVDLRILGPDCQPLAGIVVDLWHADETEAYDMTSDHHCRGRLVTGADGTVCFTTIRPPPYGDDMGNYLPAHLHLNLLRDGAKVLTTQLYFAGDPYLTGEPAELVRTVDVAPDGSERVQADLVLPR